MSFTWPDNFNQPLTKLRKLVTGYKFKDANVIMEELIGDLKNS